MRRGRTGGTHRFAFLLAALEWSIAGCSPAPTGPPITWTSDHDLGVAEAKAQQQPVMVAFGAAWCGACLRLDDEVWTDARVRGAAARFVAVHVDLTEATEISRAHQARYGVASLPTIVFIDSSGRVLDKPRLRTFMSPRAMRSMLQAVP